MCRSKGLLLLLMQIRKGLLSTREAASSATGTPGMPWISMRLISQELSTPAGIGTAPACFACRLPGFVGPSPPPVWMSWPRCDHPDYTMCWQENLVGVPGRRYKLFVGGSWAVALTPDTL